MSRAQSTVVGVAILLGITVVSLGVLTASVGTVVQSNAASADATRVAASLDRALAPVETTGAHRGTVSFTDGRLRTDERNLRVLDDSGIVEHVQVDAVVFEAGQRRVTYEAGAIVRGQGDGARMVSRPPITTSKREGVLIVGAPMLNASRWTVDGSGATQVVLRTDVRHDRSALGNDTFRVAVETDAPSAWVAFFESQNATVETTDRRFAGDERTSVVARYHGERVGYLVVHDMRLEVSDG